ncbi:aromatic acid exporter family protein [Streptomyces sp. DH24]|uniref:FUSC family protein n=1 Tax=Streptomyces sp. DH24 TaxID=3040123 RepID=UPI002442863B|nr:aromatic acid exporter family protein [Streptomyces sp. DH24]MDG9717315.1 aromatic acid exporter family protein [Streptomyces sp. DH24]
MTRVTEAVRREVHALVEAGRAVRRGPGRERDLLVQSLKAAGAALLAWVIADEWLRDPMALMAPWVALVLVQATVYSSLRQAGQQFSAICVGALLASGAQLLTGDTLVALALSVPALMLLANWPRFGDQGVYAATTALFTLASGTVSGAAVGHRLGQAALGAVIGVAVNALVLPPVHLRDVRENLSGLARQAGDVLHRVAGDLRRGDWDASTAADWSYAAAGLERRLEGLRSARGWSRESLRLTWRWLHLVSRAAPTALPDEAEDERWSRITGHVRALVRTLAVAADDNRTPAPPEGETLRLYARLLELIGDACRTASERLPDSRVDPAADRAAVAEMDELHERLQRSLRHHAGQEAARTAVLGTLLLQAENIWAETVPDDHREQLPE